MQGLARTSVIWGTGKLDQFAQPTDLETTCHVGEACDRASQPFRSLGGRAGTFWGFRVILVAMSTLGYRGERCTCLQLVSHCGIRVVGSLSLERNFRRQNRQIMGAQEQGGTRWEPRWRWCFAHEEMFVVPVEALSPNGALPAFGAEAEQAAGVAQHVVQCISEAFARYWERSLALHEADEAQWFPPRAQHICVIRKGHHVRPYFQPIYNSSWLFYEDDFDLETSSIELATYLFFHAERMSWRRQVLAAFEENLPYWLVRKEEEVADFCQGCSRSSRPDAAAFRALSEVLPWLRRLYHRRLRPPALSVPGGLVALGTSGLLAPRGEVRHWEKLRLKWQQNAEKVVMHHYTLYAKRERKPVALFCQWLSEHKPEVLLVGEELEVVWDPQQPPDTSKLSRVLGELAPAVAESLRADLEVIDVHSRRFRDAIRAPSPATAASVDPGGLSFLWRDRPIIAYRLCEPGMDRLRLPAPPYERLMLGARTMHEWGHLASAAGWVGVPPEKSGEFAESCARLEELCAQVVRDAPAAIRAALSNELERLEKEGSVGRALAQIVYARMEDYRANVVAREFLSPLELETYVRNNVTCLKQSMRPTALFQRLVRYAYEFQYLRLLGIEDPWSYLCSSTWFDREYWHCGLVSHSLTEQLFETVAHLCSLQRIDRGKLAPPGLRLSVPKD